MNTRNSHGDISSYDEGCTHLAQACREHDHLVYLPHLLEEPIDTGALQHVEVMPERLDLDGDNIVWRRYRLYAHHFLRNYVCNPTTTQTFRLLCTSVSSRSSTRHLRPAYSGAMGGSRG